MGLAMGGVICRALPIKARIEARSALRYDDRGRPEFELTFSDWSTEYQSHAVAGASIRLFEWR